jgi:hypothetical protein
LHLFAIETETFLHELAITSCELAWLCHAGAVMTCKDNNRNMWFGYFVHLANIQAISRYHKPQLMWVNLKSKPVSALVTKIETIHQKFKTF